MLILSTIVGVIYFQLKGNFAGFQNRYCVNFMLYVVALTIIYRVGAFYFITTNIVFGSFSAIELFINERPLFMYVAITVMCCTMLYLNTVTKVPEGITECQHSFLLKCFVIYCPWGLYQWYSIQSYRTGCWVSWRCNFIISVVLNRSTKAWRRSSFTLASTPWHCYWCLVLHLRQLFLSVLVLECLHWQP